MDGKMQERTEDAGRMLLTISELCRMLSLSESTVRRRVKAGELPQPVKIGCAARWRKDAVDAFIAGMDADGTGTPKPQDVHPRERQCGNSSAPRRTARPSMHSAACLLRRRRAAGAHGRTGRRAAGNAQ